MNISTENQSLGVIRYIIDTEFPNSYEWERTISNNWISKNFFDKTIRLSIMSTIIKYQEVSSRTKYGTNWKTIKSWNINSTFKMLQDMRY